MVTIEIKLVIRYNECVSSARDFSFEIVIKMSANTHDTVLIQGQLYSYKNSQDQLLHCSSQ